MADQARKVAIVTGAGRGLGRAAAVALARAGFRLCLVSRTRDELIATRALTGLAPADSLIILLDLGELDAPDTLMAAAIDHFERIDLLVSAASLNPTSSALLDQQETELDRIVAINMRAPIALARLAAATMKTHRGGTILLVTRDRSPSAIGSAAAGGLRAFARDVSAELRSHKVRIAAVIGRNGEGVETVAEAIVRAATSDEDFSIEILVSRRGG